MYYTSIEQMKALFMKKGCKNRFTGSTASELEAWQCENRKLFFEVVNK